MKPREKTEKNWKGRIVLAVVLLLAAAVIFTVARALRSDKKNSAVSAGVAWLKNLEAADVDEVQQKLLEQKQQRMREEREKRRRELTDGTIDVWTLFRDCAIMGDSRAVGFSYFEYMPEERVIAGAGWTIRDIEEHLAELKNVNPTIVFLCFGLNDTSIGIWQTPEEYAAEYDQIIQHLNRELPNTQVYVNSILPARDPAFDTSEKWREIPDYSAAVERLCAQKGYHFVNNDAVAEEHSDLWEIDGIHLYSDFYPYWAVNMMMAVYDTDVGTADAEAGDTETAGTEAGDTETADTEAADIEAAESV